MFGNMIKKYILILSFFQIWIQWTFVLNNLFKVPLVSYEKFFLLQLGNVVDWWLIDKYIKCHLYPDLKKRKKPCTSHLKCVVTSIKADMKYHILHRNQLKYDRNELYIVLIKLSTFVFIQYDYHWDHKFFIYRGLHS
jgi:hypothetical protein